MCVVDVHDNGWLAVHQWWVGSVYPFYLRRRVQRMNVLVPENSKSSNRRAYETARHAGARHGAAWDPSTGWWDPPTPRDVAAQQSSEACWSRDEGAPQRGRASVVRGVSTGSSSSTAITSATLALQDPRRGDSSPGPANTRNGRKRSPALGDQLRDP